MLEIKDAEFESEVVNHKGMVLVDFWASWCGPCRMLAPTLQDIENEAAGSLKIVKINTDTEHAVAAQFGVQSLPTLLLFKDGTRVADRIGNASKRDLTAWIDQHK